MHLIGILEDNASLRTAMVTYLNATLRYHCLFDVAAIGDILAGAQEIIPDMILLDIHLNDGSSLDNMQRLLNAYPQSKIVVITGDQRDEIMLKAIELGARGYVLKPFSMSALIDVLETVAAGGAFLGSDLLLKLMGTLNKRKLSERIDERSGLSRQEIRIVHMLKEGFSYKEIAAVMNLSYHTVNQHIKNIYRKLNINSKFELISNR
jgi:DNA-binding NarL/FixJ family response regulator